MNIPILYEDTDLIIINKPPGIVVNRATSVKESTVQDWIEVYYPIKLGMRQLPEDFHMRSGIVHRIDKETSGILMIAKTPHSFRELQRQFKERTVKKTYLAFVHGKLVPLQGEIRAPIGRLPWNKQRFGIIPDSKEAVTKYKSITYPLGLARGGHVSPRPRSGRARITKEMLTLVELYPETGRTHQLRVHLKYIGHPIVGDYLYAGRKVARSDRTWARRVMLHAWKIEFTHPKTGQSLAFEAPIPDDMRRLINPTNTTNLQTIK